MKTIITAGIAIIIWLTAIWGGHWMWFYYKGYPITQKDLTVVVSVRPENAEANGTKYLFSSPDFKKVVTELNQTGGKIKVLMTELNEKSNTTISNIIGFYSSLFTAIAIIAALASLSVWRTKSKLDEKLKTFSILEEKVNFLHKKKDLASWVKKNFTAIAMTLSRLSCPFSLRKRKNLKRYEQLLRKNLPTTAGWN